MKLKYSAIALLTTLSLGLGTCDNHNYGAEGETLGRVSFESFGVDVEDNETVIDTRAAVDVSDYLVKVTDSRGVTKLECAYAAVPEVMTLPVGDYTIDVKSHTVLPAEFNHPYYAGSKSFSVKANDITDIGTVTCKFSSIRVTVKYSENLKPLLGDDVEVIVEAGTGGRLVFTPSAHPAESFSGYFEAVDESTTLIATFKGTVAGNPDMWLRKELTDVKAGHHRIITFKIKGLPEPPEETGTIDPGSGITLDTTVEDVDREGNVTVDEEILDDKDRPGQETPEEDPDDPNKPDKPDPKPENDVDITTPDPKEGADKLVFDKEIVLPTTASGVVNISCTSGLAHLYLEVTTTNEDFKGIAVSMFGDGTEPFDLAYPGATGETLKGMGLNVGDEIINEKDVVFDISTFIPLLEGFAGTTTFKLTVVSNDGNELSKSLIFVAPEKQ